MRKPLLCIVAARKAVRGDGNRQRIIKTQHGRGYCFVASVTERSDETVFRFGRTDEPLAPVPFFAFSPASVEDKIRIFRLLLPCLPQRERPVLSQAERARVRACRDHCVRAARYCAPTACPTRSKLARAEGTRPSTWAVASASRAVSGCRKYAIAWATPGSQPSSTAPARRRTALTILALRRPTAR